MPVTINGNGAISGLVIATGDIADGAVTTPKIADGAVTTVDIADSAVTLGKMANMATASVLGRNTAGTGAPEVLSAATTRTLIGADNASNLTTGTVGTARLASGTANSTTYLRGDQTWATVSGGVTSITAGNGLSGGTITSSGTIALDYYTGTSATNGSYPVGSYIMGNESFTNTLNSSAAVWLSPSASNITFVNFQGGGNWISVAGTWRSRGAVSYPCGPRIGTLLQRTA